MRCIVKRDVLGSRRMPTPRIGPTVLDDIRAHAASLGLTIAQLLALADVNYTTWWRWTHGTPPSRHSLNRIFGVRTRGLPRRR